MWCSFICFRDVDITGTTSCGGHHTGTEEMTYLSTPSASLWGVQPNFNSLAGNPFSSFREEEQNPLEDNHSDVDAYEAGSDSGDSLDSCDQFHFGNR